MSRETPRLAVFTHDTFGMGHVRRTLHIVRAVARRSPDAAILIVTGSPALGVLTDLPPNADVLKIPTHVKTGNVENRPSHLPIGMRAVTSIRKRVIRSAIDSFRPDLFLVDNFPLGSWRELLPTLERLRELSIPAVLGLRDIVDHPDVVRETWNRLNVYDALQDLYSRILVYGTPEILDVGEAYALPADVVAKIRYCGYVTSTSGPARDPEAVRAALGLDAPVVLCTVGGGGDGFPLLSRFVQAVRDTPSVSGLAITGPLMAPVDRGRIRDLAQDDPRIRIEDSVRDLPSYLAASDLVVAMGGYNTVSELLALRRRAIAVPRNWRYGEFVEGKSAGQEWEQLMRVQALERLGLLRLLTPENLTAEALSTAMVEELARSDDADTPAFEVAGVDRAADEILSLIDMRAEHAQA